jgi:hypothetical protein
MSSDQEEIEIDDGSTTCNSGTTETEGGGEEG